jgi:hypothetical protein
MAYYDLSCNIVRFLNIPSLELRVERGEVATRYLPHSLLKVGIRQYCGGWPSGFIYAPLASADGLETITNNSRLKSLVK